MVSILIPRNVIFVAGPSSFDIATGTPTVDHYKWIRHVRVDYGSLCRIPQ